MWKKRAPCLSKLDIVIMEEPSPVVGLTFWEENVSISLGLAFLQNMDGRPVNDSMTKHCWLNTASCIVAYLTRYSSCAE